jgi:hypothetical protein
VSISFDRSKVEIIGLAAGSGYPGANLIAGVAPQTVEQALTEANDVTGVIPNAAVYFYVGAGTAPSDAEVFVLTLRARPSVSGTSEIQLFDASVLDTSSNEIYSSATTGAYVGIAGRVRDADGDGVLDAADNCPFVANPSQANADANFIDLSPPKAYDDLTLAMSDNLGNACDPDDDNDGRSDIDELTGAGCNGHITDPLLRDTDGDRILDGAECALGLDPTVINAAPAACSAAGDADGDGVLDAREFCYYGTSSSSADSDGDGCGDRREIASINGDLTVNSIDLGQISAEVGTYTSPGSAVKVNFDLTKDGAINVIDVNLAAAAAGACP